MWYSKTPRQSYRAPRDGFSLVELMVVIAIIGLLAGAVAIGVRNYLERGRRTRVRIDLAKLEEVIESYYLETGHYPDAEEGIAMLMRPDDDGSAPWLKRMPIDPWGHEYLYRIPGSDNAPFEVICLGSDGEIGGTGDAEDISNVNVEEL